MTAHDRYSSPLAERYASRAMLELWSPQMRHGLWRRLWLTLAESEQRLGVAIPDEALTQMRTHLAKRNASMTRWKSTPGTYRCKFPSWSKMRTAVLFQASRSVASH